MDINMKKLAGFVLFALFLLNGCASTVPAGDRPVATFLHLNDTYRIDAVEDGSRGGFGRVVTLLDELGRDGRELRLLHGGDFIYPSLESQLWDGEQMIEALNFLHDRAPLYAVPGNHEFDPREAGPVIDAVRQSRFTWVGDNMELLTGEADVDARLKQSHVAEIGGLRVGFVSLTLHPDDGGNVRDYAPVAGDYLGHARESLARLEAAGVDVIIGLTHLHLDTDREIAALKAQHPKLLVIAGGHEHEPEFEEATAGRAAVVKGASNARTIWQIDLYGEPGGEPRIELHLLDVDESIPSDPEYDAMAATWRGRLLELIPYLEAKIGEAALPLDGRETAVRNGESNWGNFIADQMRGAFGKRSELAFVNGGTLRIDDFIIGDITFEDVARTFGFSSYLRHMTITGGDFQALLESGYRGTGPSKGYFPQLSGFRVCIDRRLPDFQRIVSLQVPDGEGWRDIEPTRDYTLVAPAFLYGGGDGYDFSAARNVSLPGSELKYRVIDAIVRAHADGRQIGKPVDPRNPRIVILGNGRETCWQ